ncbi:MAG: hypothetical protein JSW11_04215 [Candidatus Heimdallarchaeota archaeon]|nr:MAG: hypothetical protein JSW11_04215 [Candidatus Heimdallarchaeota archaeon]
MNSSKLVTSLAIIGETFGQWQKIKELCDQSTQDKSGLAAGILSRTIDMDLGSFTVKYLILFIDQKYGYNIKPTFQYSMKQLMEEGIENVLRRIGRKTIIRAQMKEKKDLQITNH